MMLTISDQLTEKIRKMMQTDTVLVLDFDDGVGPFSNAATCTLDVAFNLILAKPEQLTDEFNATIESNLGLIYVKGYAMDQFGDGDLTLKQSKYLNNVLESASGILDPNVGINDVQGADKDEQKVGNDLSCDGVSQVQTNR
ncbi:iron-sulfur cluster biosynthesis family protein [Weissella diestrammenae]|uniref:Iron-sulfur cluster biosynthesis family protein n=1 Tax=Weissella diestrammenae TaxID=1162633 RepID=A0A7G9T7D0_9LACO|nr:iron-sulfur cluster biosynthesis family protein [Weissella diestrammenae]MCM0582018.1 iron-sulfur cluster biosynthesis family protein [Weissella diestrammenae]QNN76005.1 iron-sulfur cluster biosynthesis family protein [Weissella diestrammenae]